MEIYKMIEKIRKEQPIVHQIMNFVTMQDCASVVRSLGGFPLISHAREEVETMAGYASSLILDIGTLTPHVLEAMKSAAVVANGKGIPVVLDICGVGASRYRDEKSMEIITETKVDVLKGNIREVAKIAGRQIRLKSVTPVMVLDKAVELAVDLSTRKKCTVIIAGTICVVARNGKHAIIRNSEPILKQVVGAGCMGTSAIGTFAAVEKDLFTAAVAGVCCYRVAAELAAKKSEGPASFKVKMLDQLYNITEEQINKTQRIE